MMPYMNGRLLSRAGVYGTLFNFRGALAALGNAVEAPPYNGAPRAPILYVRPANTWSRNGAPIVLPRGEAAIEVGATFGIVIGRAAARVSTRKALDYVAGFTVANDVCLPHTNCYRPAIRERCRDGFCLIGTAMVARDAVADASAVRIRAFINGVLKQEGCSRNLIRPVPQLIADVCEFMTLMPGDILFVGVPENPPLAHAGETIRVEVEGMGQIENQVVAEELRGAGAGTN